MNKSPTINEGDMEKEDTPSPNSKQFSEKQYNKKHEEQISEETNRYPQEGETLQALEAGYSNFIRYFQFNSFMCLVKKSYNCHLSLLKICLHFTLFLVTKLF